MSVLIGLGILLLGGGYFTRQVSQARSGAWAGPRSQAQRQRTPTGQRPVRHEIKLAWQKVKAADWLEQQRHDRKNGGSHPAATSAPAPPRRGLAAVRRRPVPPPAGGAQPAAVIPLHPSRQPGGSPGRNTTVPSTASGNAVEQFVEGVNQIHAQAQAGGIHAKHAAVKACHEACVRFAAMAAMLARQMSEPGQNYGNEITEPIARSATQLQASAMTFSEADSALTTLENMTVGELAASARQAPHHAELSENGSR